MAQKVIDVTRYKDHYDELSKTPKNYAKSNYFLKELQDKVNAEWRFRPNRVDIEYEALRATMERAAEKSYGNDQSIWRPIEVVMQSVRSEKGAAISDDCRKIVFKDIQENRFYIGSKFRFAPGYVAVGDQVRGENINVKPELDGFDFDYEIIADEQTDLPQDERTRIYTSDSQVTKNIWLVTNINHVSMTSNAVIERCNGVLGSTYVDHQGIAHYHYEPVIQAKDMSGTNFVYNDTAIVPNGQIMVVAQHNDFTSAYKINQRFVIGYNQVFKVSAINNFYSNSTFVSKDVGLIRITLEHAEISTYDDFDKLIAYQNDHEVPVVPVDGESENGEYKFLFKQPTKFPKGLRGEPQTFQPVLEDSNRQVISDIPIYVEFALENINANASIDDYVSIEGLEKVGDRFKIVSPINEFKLVRKRMYLKGNLKVKCYILPSDSPSGERFELTFSLLMNQHN